MTEPNPAEMSAPDPSSSKTKKPMQTPSAAVTGGSSKTSSSVSAIGPAVPSSCVRLYFLTAFRVHSLFGAGCLFLLYSQVLSVGRQRLPGRLCAPSSVPKTFSRLRSYFGGATLIRGPVEGSQSQCLQLPRHDPQRPSSQGR